ncbi:MAG: heavy-metal-associated domain-containing protein [Erythrobacter sp.]
MVQSLASFRPFSRLSQSPRNWVWLGVLGVLAVVLVAASSAGLFAQVGGDRGIAPIVSTTDIDVSGIDVDVKGKDATDAREKGWIEAQRKAWAKVNGPKLSDGQLQGLVAAVVIEREQIGPKRYIARLGVIFDRARAGRYLGGSAQSRRSAPMLLLPVTKSGGTYLMYETRNPWQRAWAEYQAGGSRIDYVRPSGAGGDSLLLTYGQTGRRSRLWWRNILNQFEAGDVLVPVAELNYSYPGGPITGEFTARYGPDSIHLDSFTMTARSNRDLPEMMKKAVLRFDTIFEKALSDGKLKPDPTLNSGGGLGVADPVIQRLIQIGRSVQAQENAKKAAAKAAERASSSSSSENRTERTETTETAPTPTPTPTQAAPTATSFSVQFATPDAAAFDGTFATVRSTSGVRGAAINSTAIGGTSVMVVTYAGSLDQLAAALRSRGFRVSQGATALSISR